MARFELASLYLKKFFNNFVWFVKFIDRAFVSLFLSVLFIVLLAVGGLNILLLHVLEPVLDLVLGPALQERRDVSPSIPMFNLFLDHEHVFQ